MKRTKCVSCGTSIKKSALEDPNTCRDCESDHGIDLDRYLWLDYPN